MTLQDFTAKAQKLMDFVEGVAEKLSYETGFVQRQSKMTGSIFAKTLLTGWLKQANASLTLLCKRAQDFGVSITPQGLANRFDAEAVGYFKKLFEQALQTFSQVQQLERQVLQQFNGIFITDSTQVELPEVLAAKWKGAGGYASAAALKMHLTFEFLTATVSAVNLTSGSSADSRHCFDTPTGSLSLFDLGYFVIERFKQIARQQAFFISRLRPNTSLFDPQNTTAPLDLEAFCHQLRGDSYETTLFLGAEDQFPVRVIFTRCPQQVIEERRRKAHANAKRKGRQVTDKHLALLEWTIFITNVPPSLLTLMQVVHLYALRWQIELIFKLCKSQLQLDQVQGCGEHRILCQLYVRLILFVLFCHLVAPYRLTDSGELSFFKAFQLFSDYADRLITCLNYSCAALAALFSNLKDDFLTFAQKTNRKKSPSSLARLNSTTP